MFVASASSGSHDGAPVERPSKLDVASIRVNGTSFLFLRRGKTSVAYTRLPLEYTRLFACFAITCRSGHHAGFSQHAAQKRTRVVTSVLTRIIFHIDR